MTDISDAVADTCTGAHARGACEDGVFKGLRF